MSARRSPARVSECHSPWATGSFQTVPATDTSSVNHRRFETACLEVVDNVRVLHEFEIYALNLFDQVVEESEHTGYCHAVPMREETLTKDTLADFERGEWSHAVAIYPMTNAVEACQLPGLVPANSVGSDPGRAPDTKLSFNFTKDNSFIV